MIKQQAHALLEKEVDRREFLQHVGVAFLAVIGVTSLISSLSRMQSVEKQASPMGYGASSYGR